MLLDKDLEIRWFSGTGAGGQHRNKTQNCCEVIHIPTGLKATGQNGRSRLQNVADAKEELAKRLENVEEAKYLEYVNGLRKKAMENGRIRTYDFKQGLVYDHRSNKTANLEQVLNGKVDLFKFSLINQ